MGTAGHGWARHSDSQKKGGIMLEITKIEVGLEGLAPIMFDRFFDHSKTERPPEQKLYYDEKKNIVLPAENMWAFLYQEKPGGCAKRFEGKKSKDFLSYGQSHTLITPDMIQITRNGKPLKFKGFGEQRGIWVHEGSPTTKSGAAIIKQETKKRPVISLPWEVSFNIDLIKNQMIDPDKLCNWFEQGGIVLCLGTYRPRFGRFMVKKWEIK